MGIRGWTRFQVADDCKGIEDGFDSHIRDDYKTHGRSLALEANTHKNGAVKEPSKRKGDRIESRYGRPSNVMWKVHIFPFLSGAVLHAFIAVKLAP